jgi:hypothetical protein
VAAADRLAPSRADRPGRGAGLSVTPAASATRRATRAEGRRTRSRRPRRSCARSRARSGASSEG